MSDVEYDNGLIDNSASSSETDTSQGIVFNVRRTSTLVNRYEILQPIEIGMSSVVLDALDHQTSTRVALKILNRDVSEAKFENVKEAHSTLKTLKDHKIVELYNAFTWNGHNILVFERLGVGLQRELSSRRRGYPMSVVRDIMASLLESLSVLEKSNIIHGDVNLNRILYVNKPTNTVKLTGYGTSYLGGGRNEISSAHSLVNAAPEILLQLPAVKGSDMWSAACVSAHLVLGRPLFCGCDEEDQLAVIMEVLGFIPESLLSISPVARNIYHKNGKPKYCFTKGGFMISKKDRLRLLPNTTSFEELLLNECHCPQYVNFLRRCLSWNPNERPTAALALDLDFFYTTYSD